MGEAKNTSVQDSASQFSLSYANAHQIKFLQYGIS